MRTEMREDECIVEDQYEGTEVLNAIAVEDYSCDSSTEGSVDIQ